MKVKTNTHRNVTLSLPENLLKQVKVFAAQRETSMSELMKEQLEKLVSEVNARKQVTAELLELMRTAPSQGSDPDRRWRREDAYEHLER